MNAVISKRYIGYKANEFDTFELYMITFILYLRFLSCDLR